MLKERQTTLWQSLYSELTQGLKGGTWSPGDRLPSSRDLARSRGISRSTVVEVYEQLVAEGWVQTRPGSGTFAVGPLPVDPPRAPKALPEGWVGFGPLDPSCIDFRTGLPELSSFPLVRWRRAQRRAEDRHGTKLWGYGPAEGMEELRLEIARYLTRSRGWEARADQLVITGGTTQALGLVARLMVLQGKTEAWVEDPVTADIPRILGQAGVRVHDVGVGSDGLDLDDLPERLDRGFVVLTPSHQFPTGRVLSRANRLDLLSRASDAALVEDDYDSEFRYGGRPLAPLVALDPTRVLHLGTFSKTLAPGLRLAWIHLPPALVGPARELKWLSDLHNPPWVQATLAEFLAAGWYDLHLRRMNRVYSQKHRLVVETLDRSGFWTVEGQGAGLHVMVRRRAGPVDQTFLDSCSRAGVKVYPVARHVRSAPGYENAFLLGFGHLCAAELVRGLAALDGVELAT